MVFRIDDQAKHPAQGGTLTTVPIMFAGNRLELNAATKKGGSVVVEIFDMAGRVVAHSRVFAGDDLHYRVAWTRKTDLGKLAGAPVTLRFRLKSAQLYAFAFRR